MTNNASILNRLPILAAFFISLLACSSARAYVEIPYTLGRVVNESGNIALYRVEKVDKEKNLVLYRKVKDVKGTCTDVLKHNIGRGGFHPREWQNIMDWAEPGKTALFFNNGGASETCIHNYWYQAYAGGEWWNMSHAEPYFLRCFAGNPEKLANLVTAMLAGQEIQTPCMVDGDKNTIQLRTARIQRLKASLKLMDYNAQRDFIGWGGDDLRAVTGMAGFSHAADLARVGPDAQGVAVADIDNDGRDDFCIYGQSKVAVYQLNGTALNEVSLPYVGGARSASWADFNGDGKVDLLLATPAGPVLLQNEGGKFKDVTGGLPRESYYNLTAAAFIDQNGDKQPDILLANGFLGLRLYRNLGAAAAAQEVKPAFGKWYLMGPFDNAGGKGFDTLYPPEQQVDLAAQYPGKANRPVAWKEANFKDGQPNNLALFGDQNNDATVYLYRELDFGGAAYLPVSFGSDDSIKVFLNGEQVLAENVSRAVAPDQNQATLKLRPGKNQLLIKIGNGTGDFAFFFAAKAPATPVPPLFEDVSTSVGLGPNGLANTLKGDWLTVADVNKDGRDDFLYSAGNGFIGLNTPQGFVEHRDVGLNFQVGKVAPVFGDFNGDGQPDLVVPQSGGSGLKLFANAGGRFTDVTAQGGALAQPLGKTTSVNWSDFDGDGKLDLIVGCFRGPNRFLRNQGNNTFIDATERLGLDQRIFNTRSLGTADVNRDGVADLVLNNEGQDSILLLGAPRRPAADKIGAAP